MEWLFAPPVAFLIYLAMVGLLAGIGRLMAGAPHPTHAKSSTYASGEAAPLWKAAPGYKPFFAVALFFAILHLGMLILATGDMSPPALVFVAGLALALLALSRG